MGNRNTRPVLTWWHGVFFLLGLLTATAAYYAFPSKPTIHKPQPEWGELEYTRFQLMLPDDNATNAQAPKAPISTLLMKVRVSPQSNLATLKNYWGRGDRGAVVQPLLESLTKVPEGEAVNVSHFLPAIARTRLYTFPDARKSKPPRQDAFWTGMNFFADTPDNSLTNAERVEAKLTADYVLVTNQFGFGDVVVMRNSDRQISHLCVHIADNIVFSNCDADASHGF